MKKKYFSYLIIISLLIGCLFYYLYPLKVDKVIPHSEKISYIDFGHVILNGDVELHSIQIKDKIKINEFISMIDSTSYNRTLGSKNIRNHSNSIRATIFYLDSKGTINNYDLDINDKGYIVSDHNKFKMKKNINFHELYNWLIESQRD
jgi:hypothetical protein